MPAKLRDLIRAFNALGGQFEPPKSGSHWKATRDDKVFPISAHNGPKSEISDLYIRGLCRCFGIDEREFRSYL